LRPSPPASDHLDDPDNARLDDPNNDRLNAYDQDRMRYRTFMMPLLPRGTTSPGPCGKARRPGSWPTGWVFPRPSRVSP